MAHRERPLSPHLQIYKFQYTMVLSITHRFTGLLLSVGSLFFIYWLMALALGPERYVAASALLSGPVARIAWAGLILCFCYHLANGIRHLVWDCGLGLERRQARASGWAVVLVTVVLGALSIVYVFDLAGGRG
jgi:succinate dehydrogenase / fumarate reductase, cytochrome b subunit